MKIMITTGLLICAFVSISRAGIHRVPAEYSAIQAGINAASSGDTVLISPGVYYENINLKGKGIVVGSLFILEADTSYITTTIIDGNRKGSVVTFVGSEDSSTHLCGLTLRNGNGTLRNYNGRKPFQYGGGVFCENASPVLSHLKVIDNHCAGGGGIFLKSSAAGLQQIEVRNNSAFSAIWEAPNTGGGVLLWDAAPLIHQMTVRDNHCEIAGGGIYMFNSGPHFSNLSVSGNSSRWWGGGLFCETNSRPVIMNATIAQNEATDNGGGLVVFNNTHAIIVNTILWYNTPQEIYAMPYWQSNTITFFHSDVFTGLGGINNTAHADIYWLDKNLNAAPLFANLEAGDYHLQEKSPCIDAGTDMLIIDHDTLMHIPKGNYLGRMPDIGCYEYAPEVLERQTAHPHPSAAVSLAKNYPNPFNAVTNVAFTIGNSEFVTLAIYDISGRKVANLVKKYLSAGNYRFQWHGTNDLGNPVPSGMYLYRLEAGGLVRTRKMLLVK